MSFLDPIVVAAAIGLLASVIAGPMLVCGLDRLPARRRKTTEWLLVAGAGVAAILADFLSPGPGTQGAFAFLVAALPGIVAYLAFRTVLASALVLLVPVYFGFPALTAGRPVHMPATALDRAVPVEPGWILVYGSLYVFVVLPLLVVRERPLLHRVFMAWLAVIIVAYVGFVAYPTVAPRPATVPGEGFAAWGLRLAYALDTRYNCFPSLHVAHSFVSALACYRVHRKVGLVAALWASLVGASTVFTKQHYVVDVVAGALMAAAAYVVFLRGYPREAIPESDVRRAPRRALAVVAVFGLMVAVFWTLYKFDGPDAERRDQRTVSAEKATNRGGAAGHGSDGHAGVQRSNFSISSTVPTCTSTVSETSSA